MFEGHLHFDITQNAAQWPAGTAYEDQILAAVEMQYLSSAEPNRDLLKLPFQVYVNAKSASQMSLENGYLQLN